MSQQWKTVCSVADIPVLGARVVKRAAKPDVAIFRNGEDRIFALLDRCPHKGGPLSQGIVFGEKVACPLHNWNIQLDSGCATAPDEGCTQRFSVKVEEGLVFLDMNEINAPGADLPVDAPDQSDHVPADRAEAA
jgi:nitrite reductase (NADH) small subunit